MSTHGEIKRVTTHTLQWMKQHGEKISMLTAYDFSMARIFDDAGIDVILVGDSASNVMAGHETTLPITLDQMIYHAQSVIRACARCLVIVDMPFGSYQGNSKEALNSAIRIMKESGAHGVKLEGGEEVCESIKRIVGAGVPVMGHLGLTPQSIYKFGTYAVRAKKEEEAEKEQEQQEEQEAEHQHKEEKEQRLQVESNKGKCNERNDEFEKNRRRNEKKQEEEMTEDEAELPRNVIG